MLTKEAQRMQIMKRLQKTRRDETICLWGWETEVLIDYINELKRGRKYGNAETQKADSTGENDGVGRW